MTGLIKLKSVCAALEERFPPAVARKNIAAATAAYEAIAAARSQEEVVC
jgi:Pyruvate/2-oxoacid:ferredoxin oxidoreductase gamma subunit